MNDFDNNVIQYFSEDEKVLIMSGTHGDLPKSETQSGVSGLTDKNLLVHEFYKEDCELVGIEPGPNQVVIICQSIGKERRKRSGIRRTSPGNLKRWRNPAMIVLPRMSW